MAHPAAISLLLMGATLGAFWPVLHAEFINYDDPDYVTANPTIQAGLSWRGVAWAFRATHAGNWHPLTWLSHMADVQLFGQSPAGPHGVNLALHAANAVLLFLLLNGMTRAPGRSALVAGLFALHPLHVESVAWVAERKDVLSTFFGFLTLLAYANYAQDRKAQDEERSAGADSEIPSRSVVWWVLALLFFICSLMSKPMLVTLPFLMLLFDYWPLGRTARQGWGQAKLAGAKAGAWRCLVAEKIPFFVLSAVSCVITATAQATAMPALVHLGLGQRIENALVAYGQYVGKAFYPKGLTLPYLHPGQWPDEKVVLGAALVVGVSSVALVLGRRLPFLITGWFCYLGTLVPVIGLVQVGIQSMADRYTYVPLAGVFIAAVWGAAEAAARWRAPRIWAWGVGGLALLICGVLTRDQAGYWHDSERLFRHAAEVTPDNYVALANVGGTLFARGRLDEAMGYYERSVRVNPYYAEAVNSIGAIMAAKGKDEASDWFRKALVLQPNHLYALFNLGNAMANKGQPAEAARYFEAALRVRPDNYEARNNLGNALVKLGRLEEAEAQYRLALNTKPDAGRIYRNLAGTLADRGNFEEAIVNFRLALKYQTTNDPALHYSLGLALAVRGRWGEAIEQYGTTLQSAPTNAEAEYNLGYALRMKGDLQQADVHLTAALRLRPDFPLAHYNLGCVLADAGRQEDAIHHLREAVKQKPDYEEAKQKLGKLTRETAN